MLLTAGRIKFRISGTGAQRRLVRLAPVCGVLRRAFLRAITADTATASLYLYDDNPYDTTPTQLGGTLGYGVVGSGVDPATVPADHLRYSKTGVALTASATASSIEEAVANTPVVSGECVVMVDMTAANGAWDVIGFFTVTPT